MAKGKVNTVVNFVRGMMELRGQVKEDAKALLATIDLPTLADREALAEFLFEMITALAGKHLVAKGKVRPDCAKLIKAYVSGMVKP